jgi:hypothetical protein
MTQPAADLAGCYLSDIRAILNKFSEHDHSAKTALETLLVNDRDAFRAAALECLRSPEPTPGFRYLTVALMNKRLLIPSLVDPALCTAADAIAISKAVASIGIAIEAEAVRSLSAAVKRGGNALVALRLLDIIRALGAEEHLIPIQDDLTAHPDERIRSKAAYLLVRATRSPLRVSRALLQKDLRIQANAVEALAELGNPDHRPIFRMAARSPNNRVAGNAVIGLYRIADLESINEILRMALSSDPSFRLTAIWAMGETGDPRFVPYLSREFQTAADAKIRLAIVRALARIRRHEKVLRAAGEITITPLAASWSSAECGRLEFALASSCGAKLSNLQCLDFVITAGGVQAAHYAVRHAPDPPRLLVGFVLPHDMSGDDPYMAAVRTAIRRCLARKRDSDMWRLERYLPDAAGDEAPRAVKVPGAVIDAVAPLQTKQRWGFLHEPDLIEMSMNAPGVSEKTARNLTEAVERVADAMGHISGVRHMFVFSTGAPPDALQKQSIAKFQQLARSERISLHGFAPSATGQDALREVCLKSDYGSFDLAPASSMDAAVLGVYSRLLNLYEIEYRMPGNVSPAGDIMLEIYSSSGCGCARFSALNAGLCSAASGDSAKSAAPAKPDASQPQANPQS